MRGARPTLFAIGYTSRFGRDIVADVIMSRIPRTVRVSLVRPVYDAAIAVKDLSVRDNPALLDGIRSALCEGSPDGMLVDLALGRIKNYAEKGFNVVVSDVKTAGEVDKLVAAGFTTIEARARNCIDASDLATYCFNYTIYCDGTLDDLRRSTLAFLRAERFI